MKEKREDEVEEKGKEIGRDRWATEEGGARPVILAT